MARIRSLKPEFFTDADLTELSPLHRLLFAGLWCQADREGKVEDKPRELKVHILPFDDCNVDAMLWDLARAGRIVRYEAEYEGRVRNWILIPHLGRHQKFHKEEKPKGYPDLENGTVRAPCGQGAERVPAPVQHPLKRPVNGVRDLVCGDGERTTEPPPLRAAGRVSQSAPDVSREPAKPEAVGNVADVMDRLADAWKQAKNGAAWNLGRNRIAEERAVAQLVSMHGAERVVAQWNRAIRAKYPKCWRPSQLLEHWSAYDDEATTGPPRDFRKGRVGAEEINPQSFEVTGDITSQFRE